MAQPLLTAKSKREIYLLRGIAHRHGLITGPAGHRQTRHAAEDGGELKRYRRAGIHGRCEGRSIRHRSASSDHAQAQGPAARLGTKNLAIARSPVTFWDVFGEQGHPVRELGPPLLSRILELNDTQEGVLTLVFKACDDNGLLLLDLNDLRAALQYIGDNAKQLTALRAWSVSAATPYSPRRRWLIAETRAAHGARKNRSVALP